MPTSQSLPEAPFPPTGFQTVGHASQTCPLKDLGEKREPPTSCLPWCRAEVPLTSGRFSGQKAQDPRCAGEERVQDTHRWPQQPQPKAETESRWARATGES